MTNELKLINTLTLASWAYSECALFRHWMTTESSVPVIPINHHHYSCIESLMSQFQGVQLLNWRIKVSWLARTVCPLKSRHHTLSHIILFMHTHTFTLKSRPHTLGHLLHAHTHNTHTHTVLGSRTHARTHPQTNEQTHTHTHTHTHTDRQTHMHGGMCTHAHMNA